MSDTTDQTVPLPEPTPPPIPAEEYQRIVDANFKSGQAVLAHHGAAVFYHEGWKAANARTAALEAENKRLADRIDFICNCASGRYKITTLESAWQAAMNEVHDLTAVNELLREDAERYRWLRLSSNKDTPAIFSTRGDSAERCLLGADADAAIDAARAQQESGNDR